MKMSTIVALTANAVSGIREVFLENGFNDFMSKPIDIIKLDFVLEKWLPKRKQKRVSRDEDAYSAADTDDSVLEINIEGINAEKGVFLSGGTVELFYETLAIYCRDGQEKIKKIKTCFEDGDLELYTVHIHGIKSASANIGAFDLSETAALLEDAGENGDVNYIESHTPGFLTALSLLLERINTALADIKQSGDKKPYNIERTKNVLLELKAALNVLDAGKINKAVQVLQDAAQADDIGGAITGISDKILFGEYEEAAAMIDELLNKGALIFHEMW
jgi:HPt (histidine-containing phosphotransfer) domain-containing protein